MVIAVIYVFVGIYRIIHLARNRRTREHSHGYVVWYVRLVLRSNVANRLWPVEHRCSICRLDCLEIRLLFYRYNINNHRHSSTNSNISRHCSTRVKLISIFFKTDLSKYEFSSVLVQLDVSVVFLIPYSYIRCIHIRAIQNQVIALLICRKLS